MLKISRGKKRLDDRGSYPLRDTRLIVIATEGQKTEPSYFDGLKSIINNLKSRKIKIKILSAGTDNLSAPEHVLNRLNKFKNDHQIGRGDELWLVIDVDHWGLEKIKEVTDKATKKGYRLAISNPCFEVWLLCHKQPLPETTPPYGCDEIEQLLKDALGGSYNKSRLDFTDFANDIEQAIQNAQAADTHPQDRWPQGVGTHVYKVVQSILSLK